MTTFHIHYLGRKYFINIVTSKLRFERLLPVEHLLAKIHGTYVFVFIFRDEEDRQVVLLIYFLYNLYSDFKVDRLIKRKFL